ncbi:hypothetical protein GOP47_0019009 [Adiantum capillus-veneris]|uniref:Cytochrome P450 n=1 Tax=Adiantum capillus-veneris TaxID=13818 RepID=A0A9D4ZA77_ADICA|nr:hypothetical protein GOP47_0019009 [Adiantum capillus-veneris]
MEVMWSTDVLIAVLLIVATSPLLYSLWGIFNMMWLTPRRAKRIFEAQGFTCLPFRFLFGNLPELGSIMLETHSRPMSHISHDIGRHAFPYYYRWTEQYGDRCVYFHGSEARTFLSNPVQLKEVLSTKFSQYPRLLRRPDMVNIVDDAVLQLDGERWALHRRILNPGFFVEKLKAMVPTMAACTMDMLERWNLPMGESREVDVAQEFRTLSADIIANTAFGSSYKEGIQIFELQQEQLRLALRISRTIYIPGKRFLPTSFNRHCWKVEKQIAEVICQMINKRLLESSTVDSGDRYGNDLLGLLISAMKNESTGNGKKMTIGITDIIGECKTFFLAGHETTATLLSWTFFLLAVHSEWQERVREEVQAVCGLSNPPTVDALNQLKLAAMVLNESLRLYPPAAVMTRKTNRDTKLGKITIPEGTVLMLPILAMHHDARYWGPDVNEFRPERFSDGIGKACRVPGAFMPFSLGPRVCIGQAFTFLEAKVVLSALLQRYRFQVSPEYKHSPVYMLTLQPQYGVPLVVERI